MRLFDCTYVLAIHAAMDAHPFMRYWIQCNQTFKKLVGGVPVLTLQNGPCCSRIFRMQVSTCRKAAEGQRAITYLECNDTFHKTIEQGEHKQGYIS